MNGPIRNTNRANARSGFTLVELLLAMGIIAILAAILLPTLAAVRGNARIAVTHGLLSRLDLAILNYQRDFTTFPPDGIAAGRPLCMFNDSHVHRELAAQGQQPDGHRDRGLPARGPLLFPRPSVPHGQSPLHHPRQAKRVDGLQHQRPPRSHRPVESPHPLQQGTFPQPGAWSFPYRDAIGLHKTGFYDLFSVGPDGMVGTTTTPLLNHPPTSLNVTTAAPFNTPSLAVFCQFAITDDSAGQGDDITNWKGH